MLGSLVCALFSFSLSNFLRDSFFTSIQISYKTGHIYYTSFHLSGGTVCVIYSTYIYFRYRQIISLQVTCSKMVITESFTSNKILVHAVA